MKKVLMIMIVGSICLLLVTLGKERKTPNICWEYFCVNNVHEGEQIEEYILKNIPEVYEYAKYIEQKSGEDACLCIRIYEVEKIIWGDSMNIIECYPVYVGEKNDTHSVNWDWFYVSVNLDIIYWYDIIDGEIYSLEDWRKGNKYRDLLK